MKSLLNKVPVTGHDFVSRLVGSSKENTSSLVRLQFMSDLHLEVCQQYESFDFPVTAPYLVLGGDIGRLIDHQGLLAFLRRQTARYSRVFFALGNHEFFGTSFAEGVRKARQLTEEPSLEGKLTLLHQGRYDLVPESESSPAVTILGCVMWSRIAAQAAERVSVIVSDSKQIEGWTTNSHNEAHAADLAWLQAELGGIREEDKRKSSSRRVLVVTHYAPLVKDTANPRHKGSSIQSAFSTDLCVGGGWSQVNVWAFGHTHWTTDFVARNGVRMFSNQRGYVFPGQKTRIDQQEKVLPTRHTFDPSRCIQL